MRELPRLAMPLHALVGPNPDTVFLLIDFAEAVHAAPTGAVAGMLGAARFRAEKADVLNAAITAALAGQHYFLEWVFEQAL